MLYQYEGVQQSVIPMTPDKSVLWQATELPSLNAVLYNAHSLDIASIETIKRNADQLEFPDSAELIGEGAYAYAFKLGETALKKFKSNSLLWYDESELISGLSAVRANVALGHGLQKIGQMETLTFNGNGEEMLRVYDYVAAKYMACIIPNKDANKSYETMSSPVWLMSYEAGYEPDENLLAAMRDRASYFGHAISSVGHNPDEFNWDDSVENTLERTTTETDGSSRKQYVKLDIMPRQPIRH